MDITIEDAIITKQSNFCTIFLEREGQDSEIIFEPPYRKTDMKAYVLTFNGHQFHIIVSRITSHNNKRMDYVFTLYGAPQRRPMINYEVSKSNAITLVEKTTWQGCLNKTLVRAILNRRVFMRHLSLATIEAIIEDEGRDNMTVTRLQYRAEDWKYEVCKVKSEYPHKVSDKNDYGVNRFSGLKIALMRWSYAQSVDDHLLINRLIEKTFYTNQKKDRFNWGRAIASALSNEYGVCLQQNWKGDDLLTEALRRTFVDMYYKQLKEKIKEIS